MVTRSVIPTMSDHDGLMRTFTELRISPYMYEAITVPLTFPIPPKTTTMKAVMNGLQPIDGVIALIGADRTAAEAAKTADSTIVSAIIEFTLIPTSQEAIESCETLMMAFPCFV